MGSTAEDDAWKIATHEEPLSEAARAVRNRFVDEYLIDFQPVAAARRCGFQPVFAEAWAKRFMDEPYVNKRINEVKLRDLDEDDLAAYDRKRIRASLMQEAHDRSSSGTARVAALGKLMSWYGLDQPVKIQQQIEHRGGVMMVPAIASLDEWEKVAMESQRKLEESSREDRH